MDALLRYWSMDIVAANGIVLLHLLGAVAVGLVLGYERSYHSRAAGMRTYALVCLASTALVVINGFPNLWYGGHGPAPTAPGAGDPTRVIQGLTTGIGFLCSGVILRDGFNVRGLSTAASIWLCAAIGVLIGVGFYAAAISATVLTLVVMGVLRRVERALPHQTVMNLALTFDRTDAPGIDDVRDEMARYGFEVTNWNLQLGDRCVYQLELQAAGIPRAADLAKNLGEDAIVREFRLSPLRI